jgi:SAM-dependent methyltransferase
VALVGPATGAGRGNPRRMPSPPGCLLDVGCGLGTEAGFLAKRGFRAIGIDLSEEAVQRAARLHRLSHFCVGDAVRLPFRDGVFDVAVDRGALHYLPREAHRAYESELQRVLRPHAKLFLRTCLRSAGVRNDLDATVIRSVFDRWREVRLEHGSFRTDIRLMEALTMRLERGDDVES